MLYELNKIPSHIGYSLNATVCPPLGKRAVCTLHSFMCSRQWSVICYVMHCCVSSHLNHVLCLSWFHLGNVKSPSTLQPFWLQSLGTCRMLVDICSWRLPVQVKWSRGQMRSQPHCHNWRFFSQSWSIGSGCCKVGGALQSVACSHSDWWYAVCCTLFRLWPNCIILVCGTRTFEHGTVTGLQNAVHVGRLPDPPPPHLMRDLLIWASAWSSTAPNSLSSIRVSSFVLACLLMNLNCVRITVSWVCVCAEVILCMVVMVMNIDWNLHLFHRC